MSEKLEKARLYEIEEAKNIPQEEKPAFHVSAPVGWINDPNGFSVFKGKVHLFYQYHPYSRDWGPMHWGHSVTEDMIRWEQLPAALAPDQEYDREGCFSGSAGQHSRNWFTGSAPEYRWKTSSAPQGAAVTVRYSSQYSMGS